jgi:hypothetical protein
VRCCGCWAGPHLQLLLLPGVVCMRGMLCIGNSTSVGAMEGGARAWELASGGLVRGCGGALASSPTSRNEAGAELGPPLRRLGTGQGRSSDVVSGVRGRGRRRHRRREDGRVGSGGRLASAWDRAFVKRLMLKLKLGCPGPG